MGFLDGLGLFKFGFYYITGLLVHFPMRGFLLETWWRLKSIPELSLCKKLPNYAFIFKFGLKHTTETKRQNLLSLSPSQL